MTAEHAAEPGVISCQICGGNLLLDRLAGGFYHACRCDEDLEEEAHWPGECPRSCPCDYCAVQKVE